MEDKELREEREGGKNPTEGKEGVCPECKGEKYIRYTGNDGCTGGFDNRQVCPTCKGTGKVPAKGD